MLQRKEVDAATDGFALLSSRAAVADPLLPIGSFTSVLYYRKASSSGGSQDFNWFTYTGPFMPRVWVLIITTLATCFLILFLSTNFGPASPYKGVSFSSVVIIHSSFNQGIPEEPKKMSGRVIFIAVFLSMTVIWCSYSAVLTSYLTATIERPPFTSLEDMLHRTNYRIITKGGGFYETLFKVCFPKKKSTGFFLITLTCRVVVQFREKFTRKGCITARMTRVYFTRCQSIATLSFLEMAKALSESLENRATSRRFLLGE